MSFEAGIVIRHGDSYKDNEYFWSTCGWNKTDFVDTLIGLLSDNEYYSTNDLAMKSEEGSFNFEVEKLSFFFELKERLENNTKGVYRNLRKLYLLDLDDVAGEYFHDLPITEKVAFYHQFYFEDFSKLNIAKAFLHDMSHDEFIFIIDGLANAYEKLSGKDADIAEFYISY